MTRILVVDDNATERASLVAALARPGRELAEAQDGAEALRRVLEAPPDLVILDLRLPDASGVEIAGAIRAVARTHRMPFVVVTAYHDAVAALDPKRFGAACVLTKPVTDAELNQAVEHCLSAPVESEHEL